MTDVFSEGPIDPRIYKELATDMWRLTVSYLPIRDVLKLPRMCKYFNEEVVWHKHSGRLMWGEMGPGAIDELLFQWCWEKCPPSQTALSHASERGAINHVKCLISGNANVNTVDSGGRTPLWWASRFGHVDVVRTLLEANANPNLSNRDGWSPIRVALHNDFEEVASLLSPYFPSQERLILLRWYKN